MSKYQHAHFRTAHGLFGRRIDGNAKYAVAAYGTIAMFNRWNGKPHQHQREIARRLRQAHA